MNALEDYMSREFPLDLLRPDAPTAPAFSVAQLPHRAKLDQNESPGDLPAEVKRTIADALVEARWNRYPQPQQYQEVKSRFAAAIGESPERVILTAGCDQMILLAFWAAGGPGRRARFFEPTYPIYGLYARTTQTEIDRVVLDADYDVAARGLGDPVDLLLLVSPNNPTGNGLDRALVREALGHRCLVFVDEAYGDYAGETVADLVAEHPNLLVGRSLSKSLLAGVRLGYGIGHPELITVLERLIFAPYHLSRWQLIMAAHHDLVLPHGSAMVRSVIGERERVQNRLRDLGVRFQPSRASFVLFEVEDAAATNRRLLERGIRIRDVSSLAGLGEHLRVTIGSREENDLFLAALAESL
ncbi:MAG: histidinol-phosphate aminotransferase family protein [bacterium]|nr:histidinol-phosphate aminotransferase family protein [bacterium]